MSVYFSAKLRRKTYQGFFILTVISLAGIPALFKLVVNKSASIAIVDGYAIESQEYHRQVMQEEQKISTYRERLGHMSDDFLRSLGINMNARESALNQLVNEKMLLAVAQQLHIHIDPAYISRSLQNPQFIHSFLGSLYLFNAQGQLDFDRLKIFLQRQGMTVKNFDDAVENVLRQNFVLLLAQEAALVTQADMQEYKLKHYAAKKFAITTIPYESYKQEEAKVIPSESEIQAYFAKENAIAHRYWSPEKRSGVLWVFDLKSYGVAGKADKDSEDIFTKEVLGLINAPSATIASFAQKKRGIRRDLVHQVLNEQAQPNKALQQLFMLAPGRKTMFVENGHGYILELASIEKSALVPLEQVRDRILADMYQERACHKVDRTLNDLSSKDTAQKAWLAGALHVETAAWNPEENNSLFKKLEQSGIATDRMQNMFLKGQAFVGATKLAGYRVELVEVSPVNEALYEKQKASMSASLRQEQVHLITQEFIASLREHATIVMNMSLLKSV